MKQRSWNLRYSPVSPWPWLLCLALAFAPATFPAEGGKRSSEDPTPEGPCESINQYLAPSASAVPPLCDGIKRGRFENLLVLVPDPEQASLALYFDRSLATIQKSLEDLKYLPGTRWFPWRRQAPTKPLLPDNRKKVEADAEARLSQPGVFIFTPWITSSGEQRKPILVWLVAETPSGGINLGQLRNAIKYIRLLEDTDTEALNGIPGNARSAKNKTQFESDAIKIVGPTYSSSLLTLRRFIRNYGDTAKDLLDPEVISGTATSETAGQWLRSDAAVSRYSTMMHSDSYAEQRFLSYLREAFSYTDKVAFLSESDTAFGQNIQEKLAERGNVVVLRFPREISRLRNAYAQGDGQGKAGTFQPLPSRPRLSLDLSDRGDNGDADVLFSAAQTPIDQEAVLRSIVTTIRQEKIRFVGIVATDIRDAIFLTEFVRSSFHDLRVFHFDADLLMIEANQVAALDGTLAVTSYPLTGRGDVWTEGTRRELRSRRTFGSRYEYGLYNALIATLRPSHRLAGFAPPLSKGKQPALWLTAVGTDAYWPVAILNGGDTPEDNPDRFLFADKEAGQGSWSLDPPTRLWLSLMLFTNIFGIWFLLHTRRRLRDLPADNFWRTGLVVSTLGITSSFLLADLTILGPAAVALWTARPWVDLPVSIPIVVGLFVLAALAGTFVYLLSLLWRFTVSTSPTLQAKFAAGGIRGAIWTVPYLRARWIAAVVICGGVAYSFVNVLLGWLVMSSDTQLMFVQRCLVFESGVSPAAPFYLISVGWGVAWWVDRRRWWYWGRRWPAPPTAPADYLLSRVRGLEAVPAGVARDATDESIQSAVQGGFPSRLIIVCATGVSIIAVFLLGSPQSLEGPHYDRFIAFHLAALTMAFLLAFLHVSLQWTRLRELLETLEIHPIRHAFTRLPFQYSGSPLLQSEGGKRPHQTRARSVDCYSFLARFPASPLASVSEQRASELRDYFSQGYSDPHAKQRLLVGQLSETANELISDLQQIWKSGGSETLIKLQSMEKPPCEISSFPGHKLPILVAEEFIALRYLAYIRYSLYQIGNGLFLVSSAFVLLVASVNSYPFSNLARLSWVLSAFFALIGFSSVRMFLQIEKNPILNRITDSEANKIQKDFYFQVALYGSLPLIVLLAWIFPRFGTFLYSQIQPLLSMLLK